MDRLENEWVAGMKPLILPRETLRSILSSFRNGPFYAVEGEKPQSLRDGVPHNRTDRA